MHVMRTILVIGVAVWGLVGAVACSKTNPALCCVSDADCASVGLPSVKLCGSGLACEHNMCIVAECQSDMDCTMDHPACVGGLCADCNGNHPCKATEPVCSTDVGTCGPCTSSADCAIDPTLPLCNTTSGACVQCMAPSDCSGTTPICDAMSCRACRSDSECPTGACAPNGSCVAESAIIWISVNGASSGPCTRSMPCNTIGVGLQQASPTREHFVLAPGIYPTSIAFDSSMTFAPELFIHGGGATLTAMAGSPPPTILSARIPLTITNLNFFGAAIPIDVSAPVTLTSVSMQGTQHINVAAALTATDLHITGTTGTSTEPAISLISSAAASLTLNRGVIAMSPSGIGAGGGAQVHIKNTLIWGTTYRAVAVATSADIAFSTIVDSGASTNGAPCTVAGSANGVIQVTSSIIWQQGCGGDPTRDAAGGSAGSTFTSSIVSNTTPTPGTTNVDPMFVDRAGHDYHIQATSPAKDAVDTGPSDDFEGDARPQGPKFDIGADEAPP